MFNEINDYSLNSVLIRRLGMVQAAAAPAVAPEVFPVMTLESDRPEWGWLKGEQLNGRFMSVGAVAGQFSMVQMYLPSTSQQVVVIENITNTGTAQLAIFRIIGIGGGLGGWSGRTVANRDTRWVGDRTGLVVETNQNAALPARYPDIAVLPGSIAARFEAPLIITPGRGFCIATASVNQIISANVNWRERVAQPGELV